jgi:hypothetical protein
MSMDINSAAGLRGLRSAADELNRYHGTSIEVKGIGSGSYDVTMEDTRLASCRCFNPRSYVRSDIIAEKPARRKEK